MFFDTPDSCSVRTVTMYSSFTCICIPLILILLVYTDNLYNVGRYNCLSVILALVIAECTKVGLGCFINDTTPIGAKELKSSNMKKCYGKLKMKEVFRCFSSMIAIAAVYFLLAIFFGAPILSHHEETLMLSILITTLTVFPGCVNVGVDVTLSLLAGMRPIPGDIITEMIQRNIQCAIFGAWLGALVIPLDWNRPWQVWPIPCCLGAILAYTLSHIIALFKLMPSIARFFTGKTGKFN